jgi:uncharacterized membrane protein
LLVRPFRHPLHPLLVHFPVALWTGAVVLDLFGLATGRGWVWELSFGCHAAGVVTAGAAMLAGFLDLRSLVQGDPARDTAASHMLAMSTAWLLFLTVVALRASSPASAPSPWAIACAGAAFLGMVLGSWLGGELVYRFGVGVCRNEVRGN